jgi:hypothetical protein
MSARVDLQGIPADYFIDRRGALGVMTGQYTLLEYQMAGFFPDAKGFLLGQCLRIADSGIFCGFLRQGASVRVYSAQESFRIRSKRKQDSRMQNVKGVITKQAQNSKVLHCRYLNIPNTI